MQKAPKIVGRVHAQYGRSLLSIVNDMNTSPIGRYVVRTRKLENLEPSVMKICEVYSDPCYRGPDRSEGRRVVVESWSRGVYEGRQSVVADLRKCDWQLLTPAQERCYLPRVQRAVDNPPQERVLPSTVALPPLLRLHLEQKYGSAPARIPRPAPTAPFTRLAGEGEAPNVPPAEVDGLGCPLSPHLYEGVDLSSASNPPCPSATPVPLPHRTMYPLKHKLKGEVDEEEEE